MNQRTRIKICGLTREADVDAAVEAGADAIGLVLLPAEPALRRRRARGASSRGALPPFVTPVGLFVNAQPRRRRAAVAAMPHLLLQFHGDETPAYCDALRAVPTSRPPAWRRASIC